MTRQTASEIEKEATHWVMRLDSQGRTSELVTELETWLQGDARRRGALLQAEAVWSLMDPDQLVEPDQADAAPDGPLPLTRRWLLGGAAALAVGAAAGVAILMEDRYRTSVGEIRRVPLADGSVATINTASSMAFNATAELRSVKLKDGEAWFRVAKDIERPFIVEAGRIRVRAVGTAFAVRRREAGAEIIVTHGVVEAWSAGAEGHSIRLAAGARAFVADNAAISHRMASAAEIDRALAWRAGKIDLAGEPLAAAVEEFNRYNLRKIEIVDASVADERFYGVFGVDDPEGFASAVHHSLNVDVQLGDERVIRIGKRED